MYPDDVKYTQEHEWVRDEEDVFTVGITSYAAEQMGDITYVELPEVGRVVKKGDPVAVVESVQAANDVYAPVSGRIVAINEDLEDHPECVNESPYDDGWFFQLDEIRKSEFRSLMDAAAYEKMIGELGE